MQRAMATEAEATREAKAKEIAAGGEERAAVAFKALSSIAAEKNSTIIFPIPIELLTYFKNN